MDFVNGKDDIPNIWWKIKFMFQTTNQLWICSPATIGFACLGWFKTYPVGPPGTDGKIPSKHFLIARRLHIRCWNHRFFVGKKHRCCCCCCCCCCWFNLYFCVFNLADFNGRSRKTRFLILKHGHQNCHDQKHKFHPLFDTQRCQAFLGAADSSARNSSRTAHLGMWSMGKEKEQVKEKEKNIVNNYQ